MKISSLLPVTIFEDPPCFLSLQSSSNFGSWRHTLVQFAIIMRGGRSGYSSQV